MITLHILLLLGIACVVFSIVFLGTAFFFPIKGTTKKTRIAYLVIGNVLAAPPLLLFAFLPFLSLFIFAIIIEDVITVRKIIKEED